MRFQESEKIELKEIVVDEIKKEIIAFANSDGGKLYIGVCDDGSVIGIEKPDDVSLQISNMVRDSIKPDLTMFLHYETLTINEKQIIEVDIQRGTNRPYYLSKRGMRPEGVFVRQGFSSVPATDAAIRRMIKETDGDHFEEMRSLNQSLTFKASKSEFNSKKIQFGREQMRTLKLIDSDDLYTNLALLLSDQCSYSIKAAVFQGTDQSIFRYRQEFTGSLFDQINEVYKYIDIYNPISSTIEGLYRKDVRDYPEEAIREALINLIIHRDYSFSASSIISIYSDRIEFVSIGGLPTGVEKEDIMMGISVCRNPDLANVFYRLELIEAYGTGIKKIMKAYEEYDEKPLIETTKNAFRITIPNRNAKYDRYPQSEVKENQTRYISDEEDRIMKFAATHGAIRRDDVIAILGVSKATATRILQRLREQHILEQFGKAKRTEYRLTRKG